MRYDSLIYGMFFFSIDPVTLKLKRCSDFILPKDGAKKCSLVYPSGMEKHSDTEYVVSYHEHDISVKLMFIKSKEMDSMLKHKANTNPSNIKFTFV
jgi:hypothetical protein